MFKNFPVQVRYQRFLSHPFHFITNYHTIQCCIHLQLLIESLSMLASQMTILRIFLPTNLMKMGLVQLCHFLTHCQNYHTWYILTYANDMLCLQPYAVRFHGSFHSPSSITSNNTYPRIVLRSTGSGSRISGANLMPSTSLSNMYNGSSCSLNFASKSLESFLGKADWSSSTTSRQNVQ